jgi:hypothetical protein
MPIVPLKQTIIRIRTEGDEWEGTEIETRTPMKCRFAEGTKLVRSMSGTNVASSEVVSSAQIYFDKLADVKLTDEFEFTDELGNTRTYLPINIEVKRGLNGKPILTVVAV